MQWSLILHQGGFPIRKSADLCLFTAPRSLSQLVTSFVGSRCQGILLMLFFAWTSFYNASSLKALRAFSLANNFFGCFFLLIFAFVCKNVVFFTNFSERPVLSCKKEPKNFSRIYTSKSLCSLTASLYLTVICSPCKKEPKNFSYIWFGVLTSPYVRS